jgi:tetratricopeptide (TPR) repeat protein
MLSILFAAYLSQTADPAATQVLDKCEEQQGCIRTGPGQLFALADKLYEQGDLAGAVNILVALTHDAHLELRSEARFRLAALREKMGNLEGAAQALRDLLDEKSTAMPARLELARILSRMGQTKAARVQLAKALAQGLPSDVEQNVRRFSRSLQSDKRRGLSLELTSGPDSNINRATSSQYVDTIIAPFELNPDARRRSGIGFTMGGQAFSRNRLMGSVLLTRIGAHADLFSVRRFNDLQVSFDTGPELSGKFGQIRPALVHERRWYGGNPYSSGLGASLAWVENLDTQTQLEFTSSRVWQAIKTSPSQSGWRSTVAIDISRALRSTAVARLTLQYAQLDARLHPEGLRQLSTGLFFAKHFNSTSLFGQLDYTLTRGLAPIFLFGKTRRESRFDLTAGAVFQRFQIKGFSPLVRVTYSNSSANISIYDYERERLDLGFSRNF